MVPIVRTTVTLDADSEQIVRRHMRERKVPFKQALNDTLRAGDRANRGSTPFRTTTARLGTPVVALDRALQLVGELEDDELVRKQRMGR